VLVADGRAAEIYDAITGKLERTIAGKDMANFWILPGGRWALCERDAKPLEVWDTSTWQRVQTLSGSKYCDPDPVSSILVTRDGEGVVKIWQDSSR
jgi:hypothetical protein